MPGQSAFRTRRNKLNTTQRLQKSASKPNRKSSNGISYYRLPPSEAISRPLFRCSPLRRGAFWRACPATRHGVSFRTHAVVDSKPGTARYLHIPSCLPRRLLLDVTFVIQSYVKTKTSKMNVLDTVPIDTVIRRFIHRHLRRQAHDSPALSHPELFFLRPSNDFSYERFRLRRIPFG